MGLSLHSDINKMPWEGVLLPTVRRAFVMRLMRISRNLQSDPQSAKCVRSRISQISRIQPPVGKPSRRRVRKMNQTSVLLASNRPATFYMSACVRKTQRTIESRTETLRADPSTLPQTGYSTRGHLKKLPHYWTFHLSTFLLSWGCSTVCACVCVSTCSEEKQCEVLRTAQRNSSTENLNEADYLFKVAVRCELRYVLSEGKSLELHYKVLELTRRATVRQEISARFQVLGVGGKWVKLVKAAL